MDFPPFILDHAWVGDGVLRTPLTPRPARVGQCGRRAQSPMHGSGLRHYVAGAAYDGTPRLLSTIPCPCLQAATLVPTAPPPAAARLHRARPCPLAAFSSSCILWGSLSTLALPTVLPQQTSKFYNILQTFYTIYRHSTQSTKSSPHGVQHLTCWLPAG